MYSSWRPSGAASDGVFSVTKDARLLVKKLIKQGFVVRRTTKNHLRVSKDGKVVSTMAGTPSDHRGYKNEIARLRKAGFRC